MNNNGQLIYLDEIRQQKYENPNYYIHKIKNTNNKNIYYSVSPSIKKDYNFVMFLITTFKNDYDFVKAVVSYALKDLDTSFSSRKSFGIVTIDNSNLLSILITASKIEKEFSHEYFFNEELYYYEHAIKSFIDLCKKDDSSGKITSFGVIESLYLDNKIVKDYFAEKFAKKILSDIDFEKTVHRKYNNKYDFIKSKNRLLHDIFSKEDNSLATYLLTTNMLQTTFDNEVNFVLSNYYAYSEKLDYKIMESILNIADEYAKKLELNIVYDSEHIDSLIYQVLEDLDLDSLLEKYAYIEGLYFNFEKYKLQPIELEYLTGEELNYINILRNEINNLLAKNNYKVKPKIIRYNFENR